MKKNKAFILNKGTIFLVRTAVIAALYFVLTIVAAPIAFGPLQFRIGEALTLLPLVFPSAVPGLTIGCIIANSFSPYSWADIVFGTLATLAAALSTAAIGKALRGKSLVVKGLLGAIPPVFINAFALPLIWVLLGVDKAYWINFAQILGTQTATIILLGLPLTLGIARTPLVNSFSRVGKGAVTKEDIGMLDPEDKEVIEMQKKQKQSITKDGEDLEVIEPEDREYIELQKKQKHPTSKDIELQKQSEELDV